MTSGQLFRIGGLVLLSGASLFSLHVVLRSVMTAGPAPTVFPTSEGWVLVNVIGVLGAALRSPIAMA